MLPANLMASLASLAAALCLAGCAALLPKAQSQTSSPWRDFGDAKNAIERIASERPSAAGLQAYGIDAAGDNVQVLNYSDILLRFPVGNALGREQLDPGLRACLDAGRACTGYAITVKEVHRDRVGNFLVDMLGFKRTIETTGWTFNAIVLLVDDRVAYTIYGGQPKVSEVEVTRQPLGPLQGVGESMGQLVKF